MIWQWCGENNFNLHYYITRRTVFPSNSINSELKCLLSAPNIRFSISYNSNGLFMVYLHVFSHAHLEYIAKWDGIGMSSDWVHSVRDLNWWRHLEGFNNKEKTMKKGFIVCVCFRVDLWMSWQYRAHIEFSGELNTVL